MSQHCSRCPTVQAQLTRAQADIAALRHRLAVLVGGVRATAEFLDHELTEPSMPRRQVLPAVAARLAHVLDRAEGRRM